MFQKRKRSRSFAYFIYAFITDYRENTNIEIDKVGNNNGEKVIFTFLGLFCILFFFPNLTEKHF